MDGGMAGRAVRASGYTDIQAKSADQTGIFLFIVLVANHIKLCRTV